MPPADVETWLDDLSVEELTADPYPVYARLRAQGGAAWVPCVGLWFVTRWADVERAAGDVERFPADLDDSPMDRTVGGRNILTLDGPAHAQQRKMLEQRLRPRAVESAAPELIDPVVAATLDALDGREEVELVRDFFEPISVRALARLLDLEDVDSPTLRRWFAELALGTSNFERHPVKQAVADAAAAEIDAAVLPRLEARLQAPDDTLLSHMLHGCEGGFAERAALIMPTLKVIVIGGMQEPGHGAATTAAGLLADPEQARAFAADPTGLARQAVDEGLRWVSPIGTQTRRAGAGAVVGGVEIPERAPVGLLVSSANRDESVFGADADRFHLQRNRRVNAAFGFGSHYCSGHWFARVLDRAALTALFSRYPGIHLDPAQPAPEFRGWEYRAPKHLHVRLAR